MDISCIFFGLVFTAAGILFALGKLHTHLPAWKRMSDAEKKKIKIVPLARNIGESILLCGILFLLKGLIPDFSDRWFTWAMIAWFFIAGFDVWYISKSDRYQN